MKLLIVLSAVLVLAAAFRPYQDAKKKLQEEELLRDVLQSLNNARMNKGVYATCLSQ